VTFTVGYADGMAILINGKFPQTMSEVVQTALGIVQQWCDMRNLSISLNEMVKMSFTRKRDIRGLEEPTLFNKTIQLSTEVK
jgi:hypothetical protein